MEERLLFRTVVPSLKKPLFSEKIIGDMLRPGIEREKRFGSPE